MKVWSTSKTPRDSGLSRSPEGALAHRTLHLKRFLQSFGQHKLSYHFEHYINEYKWWLILICLGCTDAPSFLLANMRKNHWVGSFQVVQEIEHYLGVFFTQESWNCGLNLHGNPKSWYRQKLYQSNPRFGVRSLLFQPVFVCSRNARKQQERQGWKIAGCRESGAPDHYFKKNLSFVETFKNNILKVKVEETNRNQSKLVHVHDVKKKQDKHGSVPNIFAQVLFEAGCYMSVRKIESYLSSFLFEMLCWKQPFRSYLWDPPAYQS